MVKLDGLAVVVSRGRLRHGGGRGGVLVLGRGVLHGGCGSISHVWLLGVVLGLLVDTGVGVGLVGRLMRDARAGGHGRRVPINILELWEERRMRCEATSQRKM